MSPRRLLLVVLAASLPILFAGNEKLNAKNAAATIPADALAFLDIKVADLWNSPAGKKLQADKSAGELLKDCEQALGTPIAQLDRLTFVVRKLEEGRLMIVATTGPIAQDKVLVARYNVLAALVPEHERQQHKEKVYYVSKAAGGPAVHFLDDRRYVFGPIAAVRGYVERPPADGKNDGPLGPAIALTAKDHHVVAGLALDEKRVGEFEDHLRKARSSDPVAAVMIQGIELVRPVLAMRTATLTADFGDPARVRLRMTFADETRAEKGLAAAREGVELLRLMTNLAIADMTNEPKGNVTHERLRQIESGLANAKLKRDGASIEAAVEAKLDLATLIAATPSVGPARPHISRRQSQKNLMQIGLALHMHHDNQDGFPPAASTDKDGKPLLSWRVAILPYIEQLALYNEFRHNEAWDSPHNKALLKRMPRTYGLAALIDGESCGTYYQVFAGTGTVFEGPKGPKLGLITNFDGTSNTFMVVEAAEPVPWTKPADVAYDDQKPVPKLGGLFPDGFHAVFCDRSVRFVKKNIPDAALHSLIGYKDGMVINVQPFLK